MSQHTDFVDYLLNIQYEAEALHRVFEGTFDNTRFMMADELAKINRAIVDDLSLGLTAIDVIRVEGALIIDANQIENNNCVALATNAWVADIANAGYEISNCAAGGLVSLSQLSNRVHDIIESNQHVSTELQNIVVNGFADWNPITSVEALSQIIETRINEHYARYNSEIVSALQIALADIFNNEFVIPDRARQCAEDAVRHFYSEAKIVVDTLELCPLETA